MHLVRLELSGFKSFAKKTAFDFDTPVVSIVGPNGSGKSNVAEGIRFVLGEQSMKSMRGKRGEDLIWNGSASAPRANRASAALTFNNASRFLDIDFDEVIIERIVHRDGINEYRLNGSIVRLKDILELLAGANIGQTGHHLISQGEADKILSAPSRERREMLEDALGLKVYQYKKEESIRKLEKTEENMRQVDALRKEVAPHLRFLKRQVEKIQKAEDIRTEAVVRFQKYFASESAYLTEAKKHLGEEKTKAKEGVERVSRAMASAREALALSSESSEGKNIAALSERIEHLRALRRTVLSEASRIEGQMEAIERMVPESSVSREALEQILSETDALFTEHQSTRETLISFVQDLVRRLKGLLAGGAKDQREVQTLNEQKEKLRAKEKQLAKDEEGATRELEEIRKALDSSRTREREQERALFALTSEERELRHTLENAEAALSRLHAEEEEFKRDLSEAGVLVGVEAMRFATPSSESRTREAQATEKRELQKIKIRLEEMGAAGGAEVLKEYQEASEREAFLERELADLEAARAELRSLIAQLEDELSVKFKQGLHAINAEFSKFFSLMFDGGSASLVLVKEPVRRVRSLEDADDDGIPDEMEKTVEGLEISLSIPRKRIKGLTMLSGGERALTSIALIFAMSSVNPPPFLVLDETDAALDEANSRRYGDMIAALSEKSQLILITHNRETMSRAGVLYGVTMGNDGVSKVLSVKLEEAVKVAK
ncbi:MAG: AAA family ATPase [Patescibacteria group bacterium]